MKTKRPVSINNSLAHGICNYSCQLCSVNKKNYCGPKAFQPQAITHAIISKIQDAAASGIYVRYVANAGDGEPTLHPEFTERMNMFGEMLREWEAPVPAPEVSVVSNGARLSKPGIIDDIARNGLSLIVSFPTPDAESYGQVMVGDASRGRELLEKVVPGIQKAMKLAATGDLSKLLFHISPPERNIVRRDFDSTIDFLSTHASNAGLNEIELVMFPSTSNRSGSVRNWIGGTDMYKDLFRKYNGQTRNGVTVKMKLVLERFLSGIGEIADLIRAFRFPCLWNANLFIAADGSSICCNDQAVTNAMGNILDQSIDELMAAKETYRPRRNCKGCDQRPEQMSGSPTACIFSLAARIRLALASKRAVKNNNSIPAIDEDGVYHFGSNNRYTIRVASSIEDRIQAWKLVYDVYAEKGYAKTQPDELWYGLSDALPDTTTLLAQDNGNPVATLTLVPDSPLGLPAEDLYSTEINSLRKRDRKPCEIKSLACKEKNLRHGAEIMKHMFKLAYLTASRLLGGTDFLITVNPRHVPFYKRTLRMVVEGAEKSYTKVGGAPAVLLSLDLTTAEKQYEEHYGDKPGSLSRFFVNPASEPGILKWIAAHHYPLDSFSLHKYFMTKKPLLQSQPRPLQHFIEECYPGYHLGLIKKRKPKFCSILACMDFRFNPHISQNSCCERG